MSTFYQVSIRNFELSDVENKVKWINDPENNQFLHYDLPLVYEKTCKWFHNKNNNIRKDYVIEANGNPVGLTGLLAIDRINQKCEFYISMGEKNYKRKGIASQAIKLILEEAFVILKMNKVYLNVDADNLAACKLYEKNGFLCEGIFRQDLMRRNVLIDRKRYAMIKDDYLGE